MIGKYITLSGPISVLHGHIPNFIVAIIPGQCELTSHYYYLLLLPRKYVATFHEQNKQQDAVYNRQD
jgi:hypothetical protein